MASGLEAGMAAVAVVGFTGQIFSGCIKMYTVISGATHFGEDQDVLFWKLRVQCLKLRIWGDHWTSDDGRPEALDEALRRQGDDIYEVVVGTLLRIHRLLDSALHVYEKYGLKVVDRPPDATPPAKDQLPRDGHFALDPEVSAKQVQRATSFWKRCKWQVKDKEKFDGLLQDLATFNTSLHDILPIHTRHTLSVALACGIIDWAHVNELDNVESAFTKFGSITGNMDSTNSSLLKTATQTDTAASQSVRDLAEIKRFSALLAAKGRNSTGKDKPMSILCDDPGAFTSPFISGKDATRDGDCPQLECGSYNHQPVLVEWKMYDRTMSFRDRMTIYTRVDNLATFLNKEKPVGFRIPRCVAYVHRDNEARFALLYRLPDSIPNGGRWATLRELLDKPDRRPTLGDIASLEGRYAIAKTLAVALLQLHVCGWVHKGIRSSNVLLFPYPSTNPSASAGKLLDQRYNFIEPLVVGFGYSRPDDPDENTVERSNNPSRANDHDLYRHPQLIPTASSYRRGLMFSREFDIYALGLVLLELAFQWPLSHYHRTEDTPETFLARIRQSYVPQLASIMGSKYRDCVAYCLSAVPERNLVTGPSPPAVPSRHYSSVGSEGDLASLVSYYKLNFEQGKSGGGGKGDVAGNSGDDHYVASLTNFFRNVILPLDKCNI